MFGSVQGEISGAGIVTYLPPREGDPVTRVRPGYFLIANINSDKSEQQAFIIIFRIPDNARPGNYNLVTPDPLKVGERFDVRVETAAKGKSIVYQANTEGTITLEKFSPDQTDSAAKILQEHFNLLPKTVKGVRLPYREGSICHWKGNRYLRI